jgi:hypothetical protein
MLVMLTLCQHGPEHAGREPIEIAGQIPIAVYTVLRYS